MFNYDKLAALIDASGKSKAYLCRKAGKPEYYLRDVIRQKNKISKEVQEILASELNVTVEYLNDIEDEKKPALPKESELDSALVNRLVQLSPEEQEKVDAFVQGLIASR